MKKQRKTPKYLTSHALFSQSDLNYFQGKGYTNREILAFWDRDFAQGRQPTVHGKVPDVLSYYRR